ncbi:NAD(P)-binding domain-containing protein [Roseococcus microcysteis]|uniref:NAD(P)-binding domain-containing protein n=1 Tax=Roseococcus microcysteis TaxID=2771361 RepID=UPI001CC71D1D|nr:NAD(P)-binding domain-containing protein [Roseococcus microcysteis]
MTQVGFVGLGMMGRPMAGNLVAKGVSLRTHDAADQAIEGAEAVGLDGLAACDTIILMLPDSPAVAAVMEGLLPVLRPGALVIDMGSSVPAETRRWAAALEAHGCAMLDAPVSGSVPKARAGTLAIMVGVPPPMWRAPTPCCG